MTLLIGILCSDGIVIGSDGAATYGKLGSPTIVQPMSKISIKNGCMIMGVSGPVGLGQSITSEISKCYTSGKLKGKEDCRQGIFIDGDLKEFTILGESGTKYKCEGTPIIVPIKNIWGSTKEFVLNYIKSHNPGMHRDLA